MQYKLVDYQEKARDKLLDEIKRARKAFPDFPPKATGENCHTILLSATTGAGKTVIMSAVIEAMLQGHPDFDGDFGHDDTTFLWLTSDPQLNDQTNERMIQMLSDDGSFAGKLFGGRLMMIDDKSLVDDLLPTGKICFINTQKLSSSSNLVKRSDSRPHTFWDVMTKTIKEHPENLLVIIDEAHQGAKTTGRGDDAPASIMQRFIKGYREGQKELMPASPMVIGISATPERFEKLIKNSGRRPSSSVEIDPGDVRRSGLVKQSIRLRYAPDDSPVSVFTLLETALNRYRTFASTWSKHTSNGRTIRPIMLVQVEDGQKSSTDQKLSRTDLGQLLETVTRVLDLSPEDRKRAIVHAFQAGERWDTVSRVEPSRINDNQDIQVVVFKSALTTGWDCPRAEVMMSFRTAKDKTHIAQLVGRMVRAPLRRIIEGQGPEAELLNGVDLYLPRFDRRALSELLNILDGTDSKPGMGTASNAYIAADLELNSALDQETIGDIRSVVASVPTYRMEGRVRGTPVNRLMRIADKLARKKIDAPPIVADAAQTASDQMSAWLQRQLEQATGQPPQALGGWLAQQLHATRQARQPQEGRIQDQTVTQSSATSSARAESDESKATRHQIGDSSGDFVASVMEQLEVRQGGIEKRGDEQFQIEGESMPRSDIDLNRALTLLDKKIASDRAKVGFDFAKHLYSTYSDDGLDFRTAKATAMALLLGEDADNQHKRITGLQDKAQQLIDEWKEEHDTRIKTLSDLEADDLRLLFRSASETVAVEPSPALAARITAKEPSTAKEFTKHLYTGVGSKVCLLKLNSWETDSAKRLIRDSNVVAWLRNERTPQTWRLAIPWTRGNGNPALLYPDLLAFRRDPTSNQQIVLDIIDPHGLYLSDAVHKVKGLARFAEKNVNNSSLGRVIAVAAVDDRRYQRDLSDPSTRAALQACTTVQDLRNWFAESDAKDRLIVKYLEPEEPDQQHEDAPHARVIYRAAS